ncbi:hypothetical protein [Nocardia macrotermitis]|uniref:Uncharacterized protein n=1 Tax=Nocardia macrotermitis TaxID=2585198 RepID=A0A7K0D1C9_9NOCA|nr:hypothetical protein [Nocardia macrotermitis]MQY19042.1 hypothetical protein [Nocardia macrotermitis]
MLGEVARWLARELFLERVDRHLVRREERRGKLGVPVVTLVATVFGTVATIGWLLLGVHYLPDTEKTKVLVVVPVVRLILVLMVAYGLRASGTAKRLDGTYFGILLAEIVNIIAIIADGMGFFAQAMTNIFTRLDPGSEATYPKWVLGPLLALTAVGLVCDIVISFALLIRRRHLD